MQISSNGKVRRTDSEWQSILDQWKKSGLVPREYCRKHGIHLTSFRRWRDRLSAAEVNDAFVPVTAALPATPSTSPWSLEVTLPNGVQLRFQG